MLNGLIYFFFRLIRYFSRDVQLLLSSLLFLISCCLTINRCHRKFFFPLDIIRVFFKFHRSCGSLKVMNLDIIFQVQAIIEFGFLNKLLHGRLRKLYDNIAFSFSAFFKDLHHLFTSFSDFPRVKSRAKF